MMYGGSSWADDCAKAWTEVGPSSGQPSVEDAYRAVESYIRESSPDLEVTEVMEFEENFYFIVREHDSGVGAMELLVDKDTGTVGPEMGPNMMWNDKYGMHRRSGMVGPSVGQNGISENQAVEIALRWLHENMPGVITEAHAERFYGYYTIHTVEDGAIEGMLSVHGTTGQVWYHTWHGTFVRMIERNERHN
jgi:hypothetical protein